MDSRRLLTFRTVARERSFSRAAARLSLSQPSVSHQIAQLETEVRVRLLDRGRGGIRLTPAGKVLLEHADQIAWRLNLAERQIAELSVIHRQHVRLGAFPTALATLVPKAVARLRTTHKDFQIQLTELTSADLEKSILGGTIDVALAYQDAAGQRREISGAERFDVLQESFFLALPPEHRLADSQDPIALIELAAEDWIVPSVYGFLVEACRDAGFDPHIFAVTEDPLATRGLVSRGLGVGWVARLLSQDYEGVHIRPVSDRIRRRDIYALLPPGNRHPLARDLIRALLSAARDL